MSLYGAIATLKKRLAQALAERDRCHAAGNEAEYGAACSLVQSIEEQLEKRELAARGRIVA